MLPHNLAHSRSIRLGGQDGGASTRGSDPQGIDAFGPVAMEPIINRPFAAPAQLGYLLFCRSTYTALMGSENKDGQVCVLTRALTGLPLHMAKRNPAVRICCQFKPSFESEEWPWGYTWVRED